MKNVCFLLILVMISCHKTEDVELIFLNQKVHSLENINFTNSRNVLPIKKYDDLSLNIIKYKLKNNSDKKYFFFINDEGFKTMERYKNTKGNFANRLENGISFNLYCNGELNTGKFFSKQLNYDTNNPNDYYLNPQNRFFIMQYYDMEINKRKHLLNKDESISVEQNELIRHGVVLYPHQIKYFTTAINLPIRKSSEGVNWISDIEVKNNYQAALVLNQKSKEIKKYLTADLKKEIEENEYVIFDGVIQSNKLPVKIVQIPK